MTFILYLFINIFIFLFYKENKGIVFEKYDRIHVGCSNEYCIECDMGRVSFVKEDDKMYANYNNEMYCIKNDTGIDWSSVKKGLFLKKSIRNKLEENTFFSEVFGRSDFAHVQGDVDHVLYVGRYATLKGNILTIFNFSLIEKLESAEKDSIGEIVEVNLEKKIIIFPKK